MLLQRCINKEVARSLGRIAIAVIASLTLAACAGGNSGTKPNKKSKAGGVPAGVEGARFGAEIPPEAQTLYEQAVSVMAAGDLTDAELRLQEFLLQYPGYPGAHVNLAIIHRQNGDDVAAMADVDRALAIDPNNAVALNQKGLLFRRNGNFREAEAAYLKAVTASPEYALAHYNLGVLNELYLQQLDAALQHFEAYQSLVGEDKQVAKWITDLRRRVEATRTANVAD